MKSLFFVYLIIAASCVDLARDFERKLPFYEDFKKASNKRGYPILNFLTIEWEKAKPYLYEVRHLWKRLSTSKMSQKEMEENLNKTRRYLSSKKNITRSNQETACTGNKFGEGCAYECMNGVLTNNEYCSCNPGYQGPQCDTECFNGSYDASVPSKCKCFNGFQGDNCKVACAHGALVNGGCQCINGYKGDDCSVNCFHGEVEEVDGRKVCKCDEGYYGANCSYSKCFLGQSVTVCFDICFIFIFLYFY